jgi:hypothetical protein
MNWCSVIRKRKNYKIHLEEVSTLSGDCHTPRLRHHPLPRHRPINGHLNTRSCTEPPRRPANSRQLFLGIQQYPLLGRLSAAIYSWGSHCLLCRATVVVTWPSNLSLRRSRPRYGSDACRVARTGHRYADDVPLPGIGAHQLSPSKPGAMRQDGTAWTSIHGEKPA